MADNIADMCTDFKGPLRVFRCAKASPVRFRVPPSMLELKRTIIKLVYNDDRYCKIVSLKLNDVEITDKNYKDVVIDASLEADIPIIVAI